MRSSSQRSNVNGPQAIELIEEAVHLLRGAPVGTLLVYYGGTIPFALALLFFWAHTTWFTPSAAMVAWTSLLLVGFFAAMKAAHAEFCARLLAQRLGAVCPAMTWLRFSRLARVQLRLQAWGLFLLPVAIVLSIPFGWVFAYFQNVSVLGDADDAAELARAQAMRWPGQNHLALLILSLLSLCAFANLAAAFWFVPWLANRLLGIENLFGLSGYWFANTTFLASVTVLTWLTVDPLVKAFYTLRMFHGQARRTGADLRVEFGLASRRKSATRVTRVVAAAILVMALFKPMAPLRAAEVAAPAAVNASQLDDAINRTLAGSDFQWRLRPPPAPAKAEEQGFFSRFAREGAEMIRATLRDIWEWLRRVFKWLGDLLPSRHGSESKREVSGASSVVSGLLFLLIAAAVVAIVFALVLVWKRSREFATPVVQARAVSAVPNLQDENTQAAQLPSDGWLALAREKMAQGEWRLAFRALYLATLAQLAAEGLVSLAKFKTNLDYERELRRRALLRHEIVSRFSMRRRGFESAWYGRTEPVESEARAWLAELETPSAP